MISDHSICLMYHSLYDGEEEYQALAPDDRPYSLSTEMFRRQLQLLHDLGIAVLNAREVARNPGLMHRNKGSVVLTFDDGHRSFIDHALPLLQEFRFSAFMFLSTDMIGHTPGFLDWEQVAQLHAAGMVIGGHGASHAFLDELDSNAARRELDVSKQQIEACTGHPCNTLSFPGGRYSCATLELAGALGYELTFTSEIRGPDVNRTPVTCGRYALRHGQSLGEFRHMVQGDLPYAARKRGIQLAKKGLRKLLGNEGYHRLYQKLAARR